MKNEPVALSGAIMGVITAGLGLAVLFGVPLTMDQVAGSVTFAGAVIVLVGFLVRNKVTANTNVVERVNTGGFVVAGEANDLVETGARIRALGEATTPPLL